MKEWRLNYTVLYVWETEERSYTMEFKYLETLLRFIKDTQNDNNQKLLSFNVQRLK